MNNNTKNRDPILDALGAQIVEARKKRGMSQAALAEKSDCKTCTIGRLERGEGCKTDTLARVLDALGLTIELTPPIRATSNGTGPDTRVFVVGHLTAAIKLTTSDMPSDITAAICKHVEAIDSLIAQL